MDGELPAQRGGTRAPLHLWVVGLLLVFWNSWGFALAVSAQFGRLPAEARAETADYFADQPLWFAVLADIGPLAGVAGAVALLLQHRLAARLFVIQLTITALANGYEIIAGRSLLLRDPAALWGTVFLLPLLVGQILYARHLRRKGVLY